MGFTERKVAAWVNPVSAEADRPARTAEAMKAVFDSNANQLKAALNGLIDDLGGAEASGRLGSSAIGGISGSTVLEQLASLKEYADGVGIENGTMVSVNGHTGKSITLVPADLGAAKAPAASVLALSIQGWTGTGPYYQSADASGVTADSMVDVSPAPESFLEYCGCAVRAVSQSEGSLGFAAETLPESALSVNMRILA